MRTCDHGDCPSLALFVVRFVRGSEIELCGHHYRNALPLFPVDTEARALQVLGESQWYKTSYIMAELRELEGAR